MNSSSLLAAVSPFVWHAHSTGCSASARGTPWLQPPA